MTYIEGIAKVLPIIILIGLGHLLRKRNFFPESSSSTLSRLVLHVTLPALIFGVFLSFPLNPSYLALPVIGFAFTSMVFLAGLGMARILQIKNKMYPLAFTTFEGGMLGWPFFAAIYGTENLYRLAIPDLGNGIFVFTVAMFLIKKHSRIPPQAYFHLQKWEPASSRRLGL